MYSIEERAVNTIRFLAVDAIETAKSGHPGLPMGGAPMALAWARFMRHVPDIQNGQTCFILSAGHDPCCCMPFLFVEREIPRGSKTPGHPEYGHTVG